ncbi:MAG: FAD-dependent monooxygenase [Devosia sp.]
MTEQDVIIAGGGPTGLMLAGELALGGVAAIVVERRPDRNLVGHRAGGLHARTIEILDQRGIAGPFLAEGKRAQSIGFAGVMLDLGAFPTRYPFTLGIWQKQIEGHLAVWVENLGVQVHRGTEVTGVTQDETGVTATLSDGRTLRGRYLVGCDGGRSIVRKLAGIAFPGTEPTTSNIIGEADFAEQPPFGVHRDRHGLHSFGTSDYEIVDGKIVYKTGGPIGVMITEAEAGATTEPTLDDLRAGLIAARGTDFGLNNLYWISRFTDSARQAASYRKGRVLVAGDAAHIHPPDGGQGLQTGVQDAVNLGWKLAQVVKGTSLAHLLDTYHAERHPIGARVLQHTLASVALRRDDERARALRDIFAGFLAMEEPRQAMAGKLSGLDIHYDLGEGHPLLGRRVPDLNLETTSGRTRLYALMHGARPILLDLGTPNRPTVPPGIEVFSATVQGRWELPVVGPVEPPKAVLIRPDGYVAWVGSGNWDGLDEVAARWFGPA